jgi:hypothetical protein
MGRIGIEDVIEMTEIGNSHALATKLAVVPWWAPTTAGVYALDPPYKQHQRVAAFALVVRMTDGGVHVYECDRDGWRADEDAKPLVKTAHLIADSDALWIMGYDVKREDSNVNLHDMMKEFEDVEREIEARRIRKAPDANRLTQISSAPTRYRYWTAGESGRGSEVRFCISNFVNVAGYFLTWRETLVRRRQPTRVRTRRTGTGAYYIERKRSMWAASKNPSTVMKICQRRLRVWQAKKGEKS